MNQGPFSGLNDYDYQELSNLTEGRIKELQQIKTINKVSIPNEIMDHFKSE
jgi:nuclear pore complex protein Nup155